MPTTTPNVRSVGGWKLDGALPSPPGLLRGQARPVGSGVEAEWLALDARNAARPDLLASFEERHDALTASGGEPGLVVALHREDHLIVRPRLHRGLSSELVLPDDYALVQAVVCHIWPAVSRIAELMDGSMHLHDVAVEVGGTLVVAPTGLVTPRGQWAADPFRAPELDAASACRTSAMAYSLGMVLACLIRHELPASQHADRFVAEASQDVRLRGLLRGLVATRTKERLATLEALIASPTSAVPHVSEMFLGGQTSHAGPANAGPPAPSPQRSVGGVAVVVSSGVLRALDDADAVKLARTAGLPPRVLVRCREHGVALALKQCRGVAEARRFQRSAQIAGVETVIVRDLQKDTTGRSSAIWAVILAGCSGAVGMLVGGPVAGAAAAACGAVVGIKPWTKRGRVGRRPVIWRAPSGSDGAVALMRQVQQRLSAANESDMAGVLLRDALGELESSLAADSHDPVRTRSAERALQKTLNHVAEALRELDQIERGSEP